MADVFVFSVVTHLLERIFWAHIWCIWGWKWLLLGLTKSYLQLTTTASNSRVLPAVFIFIWANITLKALQALGVLVCKGDGKYVNLLFMGLISRSHCNGPYEPNRSYSQPGIHSSCLVFVAAAHLEASIYHFSWGEAWRRHFLCYTRKGDVTWTYPLVIQQ